MRVPRDFILRPVKLTGYRLIRRSKGDKSQYLALAGFHLQSPHELEDAIRILVSSNEAVFERTSETGEVWRVNGVLFGPIRSLTVSVILIHRHDDNLIYFVTLIPWWP